MLGIFLIFDRTERLFLILLTLALIIFQTEPIKYLIYYLYCVIYRHRHQTDTLFDILKAAPKVLYQSMRYVPDLISIIRQNLLNYIKSSNL